MTIATAQLRAAFELLMKHLEDTNRSEVELDWDYYWDIPVDQLYDPYKTPADLDLGQLSDDYEKLASLTRGETPPVGYALTWLAAVLRAVGEKTFS